MNRYLILPIWLVFGLLVFAPENLHAQRLFTPISVMGTENPVVDNTVTIPQSTREFLENSEFGQQHHFSITLGSTSYPVTLERFNVYTNNAPRRVITAQGKRDVSVPTSIHLRGTIDGANKTTIVISIFDSWMTGIVSGVGKNREQWVLSPIDMESSVAAWVLDTELQQPDPWHCSAEDFFEKPQGFEKETPLPQAGTKKLIELAVEGDYDYFLDHGSNENRAIEYAESVIAHVSTIYERDVEAIIQISQIDIWGVVDPYPGTTSGDILVQFRNEWRANHANVNRTLAHLFSGVNGIGGVAYLNALCSNTWGYAVSGLNSRATYPRTTYTWDTDVTAHELGHNVASRHTHSCTWNPPLDSCYEAEGGCFTNTVAIQGTIMSYCHLTNKGKVLELHDRVQTVMENRLNQLTCVATVTDLTASAGPDVQYCGGESGVLRADASGGSGPLTVRWSPTTGLVNDSALVQVVNVTQTTSYVLTVTDSRGAVVRDTVLVRVFPGVTARLNSDYQVCRGNKLALSMTNVGGTQPIQYRWQSSEIDTVTTSPNLLFAPNNSQILTVSVIDANQCGDQAQTTIEVNVKPTIEFTVPEGRFCIGDSIWVKASVTGAEGSLIEWYRNDKAFGIAGTTITASALVGDRFKGIVRNQYGCADTAETEFSVRDIAFNASSTLVPVPNLAACNNTFPAWVTISNTGGDSIIISSVEASGLLAECADLPKKLMPNESHVFRVDVTLTGEPGPINGTFAFKEATCGFLLDIDVTGDVGEVNVMATSNTPSFNAVSQCAGDVNRTVVIPIDNTTTVDATVVRAHSRYFDVPLLPMNAANVRAQKVTDVSLSGIFPAIAASVVDTIDIWYRSLSCEGHLTASVVVPVDVVEVNAPAEVRFTNPVTPKLEDVSFFIPIEFTSTNNQTVRVTGVDVNEPFSTDVEVGDELQTNIAEQVVVTFHPSKMTSDGTVNSQLRLAIDSCENFVEIDLVGNRSVVSVESEEQPTWPRVIGNSIVVPETVRSISVYSLIGEMVMTQPIFNAAPVSISQLTSGVYVVVALGEGGSVVHSFTFLWQ